MGLKFGRPPYELLTSTKNKISFAYFEYGQILRESNSLIHRSNEMDSDIPVANLSALLLSTGTSITQPAVAEIARWGCNVSFLAAGGMGIHSTFISSYSKNAKLLYQQTEIVSNKALRLSAARRMYGLRWGVDNVPRSTSLQDLMRYEGRRVKELYKKEALRTGLKSFTRKQQIDFEGEDKVNQFLTAGNHIMYGIVNSVIVSLGLSSGLGVIHHGHANSFVFDIADLYKEKLVIPLAFDMAKSNANVKDLRVEMRRQAIDYRLMPQIIDDIYSSFDFKIIDNEEDEEKSFLWSNGEVIDNEGYSRYE